MSESGHDVFLLFLVFSEAFIRNASSAPNRESHCRPNQPAEFPRKFYGLGFKQRCESKEKEDFSSFSGMKIFRAKVFSCGAVAFKTFVN